MINFHFEVTATYQCASSAHSRCASWK